MQILVTGAAGFIGFHVSKRLLERGDTVLGLDNLNSYYDVSLKQARLAQLTPQQGFRFTQTDLADRAAMAALFSSETFDVVINLAAQAGVRYSLENPHVYIESNLTGFINLLEGCRQSRVKHLVYASSSSVYGGNTTVPFSVHQNVDHPISLYAATKKANELMAHSYASLYNLPVSGLRLFTVYGPWGRPDMAYFSFAKAILEGRPIDVFNHGVMQRDFTYIDDIVEGIIRVTDRPATPCPSWDSACPDPGSSFAPYRIYNIGNNHPVGLLKFIEIMEQQLGKAAHKNLLPMQAGDVPITFADLGDLTTELDFKPTTSVEEGIRAFVDWYRSYYCL
jgi:UDP-glucuronate 4-epimerase